MMTPDEASARAREAVWGEIVAVDPAAALRRTSDEEQPIETALDALIRLERARGADEALRAFDVASEYEKGKMLAAAEAELTAAIKALEVNRG